MCLSKMVALIIYVNAVTHAVPELRMGDYLLELVGLFSQSFRMSCVIIQTKAQLSINSSQNVQINRTLGSPDQGRHSFTI